MTPNIDALIQTLVDDARPVRPVRPWGVVAKVLILIVPLFGLILVSRKVESFNGPLLVSFFSYFLLGILSLVGCVQTAIPGQDRSLLKLLWGILLTLAGFMLYESWSLYAAGRAPFGEALVLLEGVIARIILMPLWFSIIFAFVRKLPMQRVAGISVLMGVAAICLSNSVASFLAPPMGYLGLIVVGGIAPLGCLWALKSYLDKSLRGFLRLENRKRSALFH
jgi:uncharacterized membrane protein